MPAPPRGLVVTVGVALPGGMRLFPYTVRPGQAWALRWFHRPATAANTDRPLARTGD